MDRRTCYHCQHYAHPECPDDPMETTVDCDPQVIDGPSRPEGITSEDCRNQKEKRCRVPEDQSDLKFSVHRLEAISERGVRIGISHGIEHETFLVLEAAGEDSLC